MLRGFLLCEQHTYLFVNPELMNTNYPENKGTLNETFLLNNNKFKRWYFEKITRNQNTSNMHTSDIGKIEQQQNNVLS